MFFQRITSCEKKSVWNLKILSNAIIYFYRILKAGSRLRSLSFISGGVVILVVFTSYLKFRHPSLFGDSHWHCLNCVKEKSTDAVS